MALFRQASVKNKLILASVLGSGTALLLVGAVITSHDLVSLRNALVQRMSVQAGIVGANAASALLFNDPESAAATLGALKGDPRILAAGLYTEDRRLFATYGSDPLNGARLLEDSLSDTRDIHRLRGGRLVLSKSISFERRTIGTVVIVSDLQEINSSMTRDLVILVSVLLAS